MSRTKSERFRRKRKRFKRCWYCHEEMVYYPLAKHEVPPPNYATIEHLNSRLQFPDGRPNPPSRIRAVVVACRRCNEGRARKEEMALPKEELWRRSGSYPTPTHQTNSQEQENV